MGSDLLNEAASWLGTPYRDRSRVKHLGADCATYIHEVVGKFYSIPALPEYRVSLVTETGFDLWENYLKQIAERLDEPQAGCGVCFKYGQNFSHGGIVDVDGKIWHCWGRKGLAGVSLSSPRFFTLHGVDRPRFYWRVRDELLRA